MARGVLTVRVLSDTRPLQGGLRGVGRSLIRFGATAVAAGGAAAAALGVKAVSAASDLNEVTSKTGVVFGDSSKIITRASERMADKFGIVKTEFLEGASNIGLVGKASGLTRRQAAKLGAKFAELAADASSFNNVPMEEALVAIRAGLVGEAEPLRRFGVLLSAATVEAEAVRLGLIKTGDELTEQQKVMARASLITKGMNDASGDLARTMKTSLANQLRALRGRFTNLLATLGKKFLPVALRVVKWAAKTLPPAINKAIAFIRRFGRTTGRVMATVRNVVRNTRNVFGRVMGFFRSDSRKTRRSTGQTWRQIRGIFREAMKFIRVLTAGFSRSFRGIWSVWGDTITRIARRIWRTNKIVIREALNIIKQVLRAATRILKGDWSGAWEAIKKILRSAWKIIRTIVSSGIRSIFDSTTPIRNRLRDIWRGAWDTVKATVRTSSSVVVGTIASIPSRIVSALGDLRDRLRFAGWSLIRGMVDGVKSAVSGLIDSVRRAVGSAVDAAKGVLGIRSPSKVFMAIGEDVASGLAIGIRQGAKGVRGASGMLADTTIPVAAGTPAVAAGGPIVVQLQVGGRTMEEITVQGDNRRRRRGR